MGLKITFLSFKLFRNNRKFIYNNFLIYFRYGMKQFTFAIQPTNKNLILNYLG